MRWLALVLLAGCGGTPEGTDRACQPNCDAACGVADPAQVLTCGTDASEPCTIEKVWGPGFCESASMSGNLRQMCENGLACFPTWAAAGETSTCDDGEDGKNLAAEGGYTRICYPLCPAGAGRGDDCGDGFKCCDAMTFEAGPSHVPAGATVCMNPGQGNCG